MDKTTHSRTCSRTSNPLQALPTSLKSNMKFLYLKIPMDLHTGTFV